MCRPVPACIRGAAVPVGSTPALFLRLGEREAMVVVDGVRAGSGRMKIGVIIGGDVKTDIIAQGAGYSEPLSRALRELSVSSVGMQFQSTR